jgi:transposase
MPNLPDLSQLSHAQKDELIRMLWPLQQTVQDLMLQMAVLQERIKQLEGRLAKNSKNSSKPPSSDGLRKPNKPAPTSLRVPGQKPNGGQKGHRGTTLCQSTHIAETIEHRADSRCSACQCEMTDHEVIETRQVFELPPLHIRTIAHRQWRSTCTCGASHLGVWPQGVHALAQYGPSVKAMAVHLNQHHLVPLARTAALMQDLYGVSLSQASIQSFAQEAAQSLRPTVQAIGQAVQQADIVHADESGIRVNGKLHWLHCAVTNTLTWLAPHAKRGTQAFEALGLLQGIQGVLVHDGLASYKGLDCAHSLCNAHHIRELVYIHEQENEKIWDSWAQEMIDLLLQALREVDQAVAPLDTSRQVWFEARWSALLERGEAFNQPKQRTGTSRDKDLGQRGRIKQSKAVNLLKRLRQQRQEVWRFMTDAGVPFTNNLAEQALRMAKVKQKVSGCFRTEHGAATFFTIRSYLATMTKQKANLFACLVSVFNRQTIQPCFSG